jgi:hypothetical protein
MGYKRNLIRVAMDSPAEITRGGRVTPGKLVNLSEQGVRVRTTLGVRLEEELGLGFDLGKNHRILCTIQVTYTTTSEFGARFVTISPEDQKRLTEYIDDRLATNMGRL